MDASIDAVLVQRLADLGYQGGSIGGGTAGGLGGARGAAWAAKRLKTHTAVDVRSFEPSRAQAVIEALHNFLMAEAEAEVISGDRTVAVRGVVGSGTWGLSPAYVIALVDTEEGRLRVAAHAKEGLIKQHTAQKAVQAVLAAVEDASACGFSGPAAQ